MSDITQKTIEEIEKDKLQPRPKWHFVLKNCLFWLFFAFSIFIGSLAVTAILYLLFDNDWDIYPYLGKSFMEYVLISIPYLWISILILFSVISYLNFKQTQEGYKRHSYSIILISIFASFIFGGILFCSGLIDSEIHEGSSCCIPFYDALIYDKTDIWDNPQNGLLSGQIIKIENSNEFVLRDFNGNIWQAKFNESGWQERRPLLVGMNVRLAGQNLGNNIFLVNIIRPWEK